MDTLQTSPVPINLLYKVQVFNLPENRELHLVLNCENEDEENSAIVTYFQLNHSVSHEQELIHSIVFHMIDEPAYDFLRTKEQLGYLAYSRSWNFRGVLGGGFVIQSSKKSPEFMLK